MNGLFQYRISNLLRIVTLISVTMTSIGWNNTSFGGSPMTDLPKDKAAASRRALMSEIPLFDWRSMSDYRQTCAAGKAPDVIASYEVTQGKHSHPPASVYCTALVSESLRKNWPLALYGDMALQQKGLGLQAVFEDDDKRIGNDDNVIARNVRRAANEGKTTYPHLQGGERELPCPLAFDAGAVAGAVMARDDKTLRLPLTKQQITAIAEACYDPKAKEPTPAMKGIGEQIVKAGHPNGAAIGLSLNLAGLLAGEALGYATVQEAKAPAPLPPSAKGRKPASRGKQESQAGEDADATRLLRSVSR